MKPIQPLAISAKTIVTSCGVGELATYDALSKNLTGLKHQSYEGLNFDTWLGRVKGVESILIEEELSSFNCRNNQLACFALDTDNFRQSVDEAIIRYGADRIGVFVGTSTAGGEETEKAYRYARENNQLPDNYNLLHTQNMSSLLSYTQHSLGLSGPGFSISTACSSSAKVFAAAYRQIITGQCDAAVVGGVDSLCLSTLYGFNSLQLVSNDICRPFDVNRNGITIGEAGGFVLLELAEKGHGKVKLKGYGESNDAYHMSTPHPDGDGAVKAMNSAMTRAGMQSTEIDYVNLHGTATRSNDIAEARGLLRVFGENVSCSSTKGFTGHTLGAAGITEAIFSVMMLEKNFLASNLNMEKYDDALGVKPLLMSKSQSMENVMTNNFGFGGNNCSLIFGW